MFDAVEIPIKCPKCQTEIKKSLGWLKANNELVCSCGARILLDKDQFTGPMQEIDQSLESLDKALKNFGKN